MNFSFVNNAIGFGNKLYTYVKPHIPTIAVVGGSAAVVGGAFLACKATLHVDQVVDEHNAMMSHVKNSIENLPEGSLTKKEITEDKLQCYAVTARKLVKLYGPAISLSAAGFAAIFFGFGMLKRWHALAVSSVAAIDNNFKKYRNGVIEQYGADVDKRLAGEVIEPTKKTVEIKKNEDEDAQTEERDAIVLDDLMESDFVRVFDNTNPRWENNYLFNDNFFQNVINYYTRNLQAHRTKFIFMNKILKEFGFEKTGIGHFYGWTDKPGAAIDIEITPCVRYFDSDEDKQMPMLLPIDTNNELDLEFFKDQYIEDESRVCYILKFNVDTDENGVPKNIYNYAFGTESAA